MRVIPRIQRSNVEGADGILLVVIPHRKDELQRGSFPGGNHCAKTGEMFRIPRFLRDVHVCQTRQRVHEFDYGGSNADLAPIEAMLNADSFLGMLTCGGK